MWHYAASRPATAHGIVAFKMASNSKDVEGGALDLTRWLETADGVQEQLWVDAQKSRAEALKVELKELTDSNQRVEAFNQKLEGKVQMVKDNHARIVAGLERFRQQQLSRKS